MRSLIITLFSSFLLGALASTLHAAGSQGPSAPGSRSTAETAGKSCKWEPVGDEGCSVTLVMTQMAKDDERDGDYCGQLFIDCPAGNPDGDPAESCNGPLVCNLHKADSSNQALTATCDGQDFKVRPKTGKSWEDGFKD